jgi:hypothetical protein
MKHVILNVFVFGAHPRGVHLRGVGTIMGVLMRVHIDRVKVLEDVVPIPTHDVLDLIVVSILVMLQVMSVLFVVLVIVMMQMLTVSMMMGMLMSTVSLIVRVVFPAATSHVLFFLLLQGGRHVPSPGISMVEPLDHSLQGLFDVDVHLEVQLARFPLVERRIEVRVICRRCPHSSSGSRSHVARCR